MSDSYKKYFLSITLLQALVVCCSVLISSVTWSEVATAADENTETVVVGKIIQDQQQTSQNQTATQANATETTVSSPQIANDMAEGESIRGLPTLNVPVVDQANLLTESQKQEISQRILALHEQGKAQIGVVIVPTTGQEDIFDFAMRIAEKWQLGSAKQDNGLLMAIAVNDRRIQILT
ncbi:MAG: TPM domain-containing protein, partial [Acinetobacter sp.]